MITQGCRLLIILGADRLIKLLLELLEFLKLLVCLDHALGNPAGMACALMHAAEVVFNLLAKEIVAFAAAQPTRFFQIIKGESTARAATDRWAGHGGLDFRGGLCGSLLDDILGAQQKALGVGDALLTGAGFAQALFFADAVNNLSVEDGSLVVTVFALHHCPDGRPAAGKCESKSVRGCYFFIGYPAPGSEMVSNGQNAVLQWGSLGASVAEVANWFLQGVLFELIVVNIFGHITSKLVRGLVPAAPGPDSNPLMELAMEGETDAEHVRQAAAQKKQTAPPPDSDGESHEAKDNQKASALEDARWVEQAKAGNTRAFDQLVSKHRGRIYAMIYQMVKNDADAWDLAQEAFIKAWKALPGFESRARFSTWLFRISHNVVYDWLRKRRLKVESELNDEVFDAGRIDPGALTMPQQYRRPDEALEQSELQQRIEDALAKLSDEHREVIVLREIQGLDYKEIAEIIDGSMGTVMSRLYYARQKLQGYLKSEI